MKTQIANIYPIANQAMYKHEDFVMVLAHLIDKYKRENFREDAYIIMDNGLYEKAQVSTDIKECIKLAEASELDIDEIIIPDVVNDPEATKRLFINNLPAMMEYGDEYSFMFVAQAKTIEELRSMIDFANCYCGVLRLTVGISKLSPIERDCDEAIKIYKTCKCPIHFLGIKESFDELEKVRGIIRSCDTSQLAFMVKNNVVPNSIESIIRYHRDGEDIDLAVDDCDQITLTELKKGLLLSDLYGLL